jgi:hypothetical protein
MAVSFIGGDPSTRGKPQTCRKSLTNFITECCIEYTLPSAGFELTTLVVIAHIYMQNLAISRIQTPIYIFAKYKIK